MSSTVRATFYVQFKKTGSGIQATALTQMRPKLPRRGLGAVVVKFTAEMPSWVFDPLDLVAVAQVPAEYAEPLIRLESVGPVVTETTDVLERARAAQADIDELVTTR